jgi:regulator of replication initiation timing
VTEPDPLADLAAQLADLRGQLARSQGEIRVLREQLEGSTGQVMMFRLEVKQLRERLEEAAGKRQLVPPPAPSWEVAEDAGREQLAALRHWVEQFLRRWYPGYLARLPVCWPAHGEALWELATLCAEWERIYADEDNRDLQGALAWHDRWLPGVLARLAAALVKCDETGCQLTRRYS